MRCFWCTEATDVISVCIYGYCSAAQGPWEKNKSLISVVPEWLCRCWKQFSIVKPRVIEFGKVDAWGLEMDVYGVFVNESAGRIGGVLHIRNRKLVGWLERQTWVWKEIFWDPGLCSLEAEKLPGWCHPPSGDKDNRWPRSWPKHKSAGIMTREVIASIHTLWSRKWCTMHFRSPWEFIEEEVRPKRGAVGFGF